MKITLRKANAIQAEINETIKKLNTTATVSVHEFEDHVVQIQDARDVFFKEHKTRLALTDALYEIRRKVAEANAKYGINDLLTDAAENEKLAGYLASLAAKGERLSDKIIEGKLKKIRDAEANPDRYYGMRDDEVQTSIFSEAEVEEFKNQANEMRKSKRKLQDRLLELNVEVQIELGHVAVQTLKEAGII